MQKFQIVAGENTYIADKFISHGNGSIIELLAIENNGLRSVILIPSIKIDSIARINQNAQEDTLQPS